MGSEMCIRDRYCINISFSSNGVVDAPNCVHDFSTSTRHLPNKTSCTSAFVLYAPTQSSVIHPTCSSGPIPPLCALRSLSLLKVTPPCQEDEGQPPLPPSLQPPSRPLANSRTRTTVGPDDSGTQTLQQEQPLQGSASNLFATGETNEYCPWTPSREEMMFPSFRLGCDIHTSCLRARSRYRGTPS